MSLTSPLGCEIVLNIFGNFNLGENVSIAAGAYDFSSANSSFSVGSVVNTTGLDGEPPAQTSGTPQGTTGAGGGHGERGAACWVDKSKKPEDTWGGDTYSWSVLMAPWCYWSKGGSTSKEVDYGRGGEGRVRLLVKEYLVVDGDVLADGVDGGNKGGGGSGGSIHISAHKM